MKKLLLLMALLPFAAEARLDSGNTVGNGGQIVSCRTPQGLQSSMAFDLYEGKVLFRYSYDKFKGLDPKVVAIDLARKIDKSIGGSPRGLESVEGKTRFVLENLTFLPPGTGLIATPDTGEFVFPKNCDVVQTINFRSNQKIYVDSDAWNQLDEVSRAALYLHEAVYWHLREGGVEKDSRRARKIVAYLMEGLELTPRALLEIPSRQQLQFCHSLEQNEETKDWNTKVLVYRAAAGTIVVQPLRIGGFRLLEQTVLLAREENAKSDLVLDIDNPTLQTISGWARSSTNDEIDLRLTWGQGGVKLRSRLLEGVILGPEPLQCVTLGRAEADAMLSSSP